MLTKSDLNQIGNVIDEKLEKGLDPIKKDLKYLKKKVNRIDKTVSLIVRNYDEADVKLQRRVSKIEQHMAVE